MIGLGYQPAPTRRTLVSGILTTKIFGRLDFDTTFFSSFFPQPCSLTQNASKHSHIKEKEYFY